MSDLHSARQFYINTLLPAYERMAAILLDGALGSRRDINALGEAAVACLHLADYLVRDPTVNQRILGAPKSKEYIADLAKRYEAFAICMDVANAYKHRGVSRQDRTIIGLDSIREHWAIVRFSDGEGHYWVARKVVQIQLVNGRITLGHDLIRETLKVWGKELARLGVVASAPEVADIPRRFVGRSEAPAKPSLRLDGVVGEHFESQVIFMRFEPTTGRYLPLDEPLGVVLEMDGQMQVRESPLGSSGLA